MLEQYTQHRVATDEQVKDVLRILGIDNNTTTSVEITWTAGQTNWVVVHGVGQAPELPTPSWEELVASLG